MDELIDTLLAYFSVGALAAVVVLGCFCYAPRLVRQPLPLPRFRPGFWTGYDVFLSFMYYQLLVPFFLIGMLWHLGFFETLFGPDPDIRRAELVTFPLSLILTLALISTVLFARNETRPHDYGLTMARWPANVMLGCVAFSALTPVVLGLFEGCTRLLGERGKHDIERMVSGSFFPWEWAFLLLRVIIGAPLMEEILFRGLLLGWLRRASHVGHWFTIGFNLAIGAIPLITYYVQLWYEETLTISLNVAISCLAFAVVTSLVYTVWLLRKPAIVYQEMRDEEIVETPPLAVGTSNLALYGSAVLFGTMHCDAWPAPIPLLLLGLALGWLGQRTQSLIGPIVCHSLFNTVAFLVLWWKPAG